jgi:hypothetical protein
MTYLTFSTGKYHGSVDNVLPDPEQDRLDTQASLAILDFPQSFPHRFLGLRHFLFSAMPGNDHFCTTPTTNTININPGV